VQLIDRPRVWVGRQQELAVVQDAVDLAGRGEGSVIWVEGEPGIGKSTLVATGLDGARDAGCEVYWGAADQLSQRLPLRVALDCLQVTQGSADQRRAAIVDYLRNQRPGLLAVNDVVYAAAEMLLALVDELCAASPTVLVFDDLQWADEASLTAWHRLALAVGQLPLLLIGTCHTAPRRSEVQELRAAVRRHGGTVVRVGPLEPSDVDELVTKLLGAAAEGSLADLVTSAMGNPLYVRELIGSLGRDRVVAACPAAPGTTATTTAAPRISADALGGLPPAFAAALSDRLSFMPTETMEMLRAATLFGREFAVTDLAALLRRPAFELTAQVQDALASGIIAEVDSRLVFRHPLIRQALYDGMPWALRAALHRDAARTLAESEAEPLVVAQQLAAVGPPGNGWARRWLIGAAPALAARAPQLAVELLHKELDQAHVRPDDGAVLTVALVRILFDLGRHDEVVTWSRRALAVATEPAMRGEIHWLLARSMCSIGNNDDAVDTVRRALLQDDLPAMWRARLLASLAMFQRAGMGDLDAADATAREALRTGEEAPDTFATAYALVDLWLTYSVRRDHVIALECINRALAALGAGGDHADLRSFVLDGRIFTMQNLDRWPEAEATLQRSRKLAHRNDPGTATPSIAAAVLLYWLGRWDDALAELGPVHTDLAEFTYSGLRERGPALLWHGVAALIAARRDDRRSTAEALSAGLAIPLITTADRENSDFLIAAHALVAEQDGDPHRALSILSALLDRRVGEMTLTHQWLPDLVRLALAVGDESAAVAAVRACAAEATAESKPARATAASNHCAGLRDRNPAALRQAVDHYKAVGPPAQVAGALEDLAVVLAEREQADDARKALNEAVERYTRLGAVWDIGRAERRLRGLGIRRGVHGPRPARAAFGWDALTPTELKIAGQVAQGQSTPKIAEGMYLSRRTVQTHISHILTKLGARSRVEIAREAFRHGVATAQ
jgi:DNA-binding CsgD family transcriptional regulator